MGIAQTRLASKRNDSGPVIITPRGRIKRQVINLAPPKWVITWDYGPLELEEWVSPKLQSRGY